MSQTHQAAPNIRMTPPDQAQREAALNPAHSVIVQAPAGSGKTDLLTRRFLRLLPEVEEPGQIVAITFTKAAAAEMQQRILSELEKANGHPASADDKFSMQALASRALQHARTLGWNLLESPAQLRISTIDSFCRELAIQQPLVSGFPGDMNVVENAAEFYRKAARRMLQQIGNNANPSLVEAIQDLLTWRDNTWTDVEDQLVGMLEKRDRWMQDFVLRSGHDWDELRSRLEAPFACAVSAGLDRLTAILSLHPGACAEAHLLARFACEQSGRHRELAELADFPCGPFQSTEELDAARSAIVCLADMLLTGTGEFRAKIDKSIGFPASSRRENDRMKQLIQDLKDVPGLRESLRRLQELPPARYSDDEWRIVRACFTLLRHSAGELRIAFEEAGVVDFAEISQRAQLTLESEDGLPTEAGFFIADRIHHLLVDEFQDTSRRQHKLVTSLVRAWPDSTNRTVFVVGDPMQSIYFFRDAEPELFDRVRRHGLELDADERLLLAPVVLKANFRTAANLVQTNNEAFAAVFDNDGSGIEFSSSIPARIEEGRAEHAFSLHLDFMPEVLRNNDSDPEYKRDIAAARESALAKQLAKIVALIRAHEQRMKAAREIGGTYRIAVLGRTKNALAPIAAALRREAIPFRAVDLENLADRPEILDLLALARAISNPEDRVAWLSILRAPWCGLRADQLHTVVSADDPDLVTRNVPDLIDERADLLDEPARSSVKRVRATVARALRGRGQNSSATLGTWLRAVWQELGGDSCVDRSAAENMNILWDCLDALPNGEVDLLGEGLRSKLSKLTAQADPDAESAVGVQLMTIHKSKGLEFEVVIVPELQAACGRAELSMLSWLERGIVDSSAAEGPSEFLIAPRQSKGSQRGNAKAWVDGIRRSRERQETRRVLYVAATRAREELHFFARPEYDEHSDSINRRAGSLLETAWTAIGRAVESEFANWNADRQQNTLEFAASAKIIEMPPSACAKATNKSALMRLRARFAVPERNGNLLTATKLPVQRSTYDRHKGGIPSRALGTAVHMLLEHAARLRQHSNWDEVKHGLGRMIANVAASIRSYGLARRDAEQVAAQALDMAKAVLSHDVGAWVLSPHKDAESEIVWTDWNSGVPRTVRVDRVFRAGSTPMQEDEDTWWIVDYKTAHIETLPEAMTQARSLFEDQLNTYAHVLRSLRRVETRIHAGLYYPRVQLFDWWEI